MGTLRYLHPTTSLGVSSVMNGVRTALVISTALVAVLAPYFGSVLGAVGGLTDALLSFVLPPLIFLKAQKRSTHQLTNVQKLFYHAILAWGLSIIAFTVYNLSRAFVLYL